MYILSAVSFNSLIDNLGLFNVIPLFYLEASKAQFDMPIKATFGCSNKECNTFNGLYLLISARPISSNTIVTNAF